MGTRAFVGVKDGDTGEIIAIHVSYDGQPGVLGRTLRRHYNSLGRALDLIEMGDAVSVEATLGRSQFRHRNLGHPLDQHVFDDEDELFYEWNPVPFDYVYVWQGRGWTFSEAHEEDFKPLTEEEIRRHDEEAEAVRRRRPADDRAASQSPGAFTRLRRGLQKLFR